MSTDILCFTTLVLAVLFSSKLFLGSSKFIKKTCGASAPAGCRLRITDAKRNCSKIDIA